MARIPIEHWKQKAEELNLNWSDVRDCYHIIRESRREYEATVSSVRRRAFTELCIRKNNRAFWSGSEDCDNLKGFDVIADEMSSRNPELIGTGSPTANLFSILSKNDEEIYQSDEKTWSEAIQLLYTSCPHQSSSVPF